jgi:hypothetical protein
MYELAVVLHSWLRWVVILLGLLAIARGVSGRAAGRSWLPADSSRGRLYVAALDAQVLVGLVLYLFLSPMLSMARADLGAAMANGRVRFWVVEHLFMMVVAVALAHVGSVRIRRASSDGARFARAALFYGLSLAAVLIGSPWPGLPYARPLFRLW